MTSIDFKREPGAPRMLGQFMGDPDHVARAAGRIERLGIATIAGAANPRDIELVRSLTAIQPSVFGVRN